MYKFTKISQAEIPWDKIESCYDSTCFHSRQWHQYLNKIGHSTFVVSIECENETIGYFVGECSGFIFKIVSAPMSNSGTYSMGLTMTQNITESERVNIYKLLANWLFVNNYAHLLQIDDWQLRRTSEDWIPYENFHHDILEKNGIKYTIRPTLCAKVNTSIEEMWSKLHYKSCKYSINKAKKNGLYIKQITNVEEIDEFVKIHYSQLTEVCKKQGMRPMPSQRKNRMKILCESLFPNRVLMLEVIGNDDNGKEQVMSSGIFAIDKGQCSYWTGASYQRYQKYCPNELMVWEAMSMIHNLGGGELNFGGMATYKLKFGTVYEYVPRFNFAKYNWLTQIRPTIKKIYNTLRSIIARIKGRKSFK